MCTSRKNTVTHLHGHILSLSLNSQYKTDLHFQQLYTTGTTCHYIPYKQNITFIFLLHVYIDIFLFQCSFLYFNSTCHFPLKQVSCNMSLSISEIITKKAGPSSTFANLHSGCPVQVSAMTIATLNVSIISFNYGTCRYNTSIWQTLLHFKSYRTLFICHSTIQYWVQLAVLMEP